MSPLEKAQVQLGAALGAIDEALILLALYPGDTVRAGKYLAAFLESQVHPDARKRTTEALPTDDNPRT